MCIRDRPQCAEKRSMSLIEEAFAVTKGAYEANKAGHTEQARPLFLEGIRLFSNIAAALAPGDPKLKIMHEEIERMRKIVHPPALDQANDLCTQAIQCEKAQQIEQARDLYVRSAEQYMRAHKLLEGDSEKQQQVHAQLTTIIQRGETLKTALSGPTFQAQNATEPAAQAVRASKAVSTTTGRPLTDTELAVLRDSSRVNGHICLPWLDSDLHEAFSSREQFEDEMLLELSENQKPHFSRWARPPQLHAEPRMIVQVSPQSVTQTVVTNCSFVCSLAVSAGYEAKFKRALIGSIVYPQNRSGTPVISPSGKYMVRLNFNGIARKVVIDDRLPVDRHNQLLTSFSKDPSEFWIPIIEKAFLKVMGMSYDFPGSSSHIDLYTLTGP
eukprot:TRINITY_DN5258_c0_g1_i7.p1 TRINITY_DN5258_c0_g1~~TRINITY_DN5258_c0_g1_i7.p1  ORF type:complete len:384 (-),score=101.14 TRINITY_DN5258_c0_g1_i7:1357-2508(-)